MSRRRFLGACGAGLVSALAGAGSALADAAAGLSQRREERIRALIAAVSRLGAGAVDADAELSRVAAVVADSERVTPGFAGAVLDGLDELRPGGFASSSAAANAAALAEALGPPSPVGQVAPLTMEDVLRRSRTDPAFGRDARSQPLPGPKPAKPVTFDEASGAERRRWIAEAAIGMTTTGRLMLSGTSSEAEG